MISQMSVTQVLKLISNFLFASNLPEHLRKYLLTGKITEEYLTLNLPFPVKVLIIAFAWGVISEMERRAFQKR